MQTEIIPRIPEIECYICGSIDVNKLCHYCGRAMCLAHGPFIAPQHYPYVNRVENLEFSDLDLAKTAEFEDGVHCEHCLHYTVSYEPVLFICLVVGLVFTIGSVRTAPTIWSTVLYLILGTTIIGMCGWSILKQINQRHHRMYENRPPLPIFGKFPQVSVKESVSGQITLSSNGRYDTKVSQTKGNLAFSIQLLEDDRKRLNKYRQKYALSGQRNLPFHAGFLMLRGTDKIYPKNGTSYQVNPIPLTDSVANQTYLEGRSEIFAHDRQWQFHYQYGLKLNRQSSQSMTGLPIQIVPTLLSEGQEWALALFVQVNPKTDASDLVLSKVENLTLNAPADFGPVESHMPSARTSANPEQGITTIIWKNIGLDSKQDRATSPHATFYLRFRRSATVEPDAEVNGSLRLTFNGTLSALEGAILYSPLGYERVEEVEENVNIDKHTIIDVAFRFHLEGLCLRRFYPIPVSLEQLTTVPGSEMITRLVNVLSDNHMYVQRVLENPPRMNRANAQIMNRSWVIAGRRYNRATPVDFRIVAVGQEQYENSDKPFDGNTQFDINIQGTVIEEEMKADIDALRDEIVNIIQCVPELEIKLNQKDLRVKEWGNITGKIINTGQSIVQNITISVLGIKVEKTEMIEDLLPEEERMFEMSVYAEEKGDVPITVSADCRDRYGQLPSRKFWFQIFVSEQPGTPTIGHQTNLYGPATGNIHTGGGDIKDRDRRNRLSLDPD